MDDWLPKYEVELAGKGTREAEGERGSVLGGLERRKGAGAELKEAGDSGLLWEAGGAPAGVGLGAVLLAERGMWLTRGDEMARVGGRGM